jgi:MFS family permease
MDKKSGGEKNLTFPLQQPILLGCLGFGFLWFALPIYSKILGASALEIGGMFSIFSLTIALLRPFIGIASDKMGRKYFFVAALICYAASMVIFSMADNIIELYAGQIVSGFGSAMMIISAYTMATDLAAPEEWGKSVGRIDEAIAKGNLIGGIAGFLLISNLPKNLGWQIIFSGYALSAAVGAWMGWRRVPETRPTRISQSDGERTISRELVKLMAIVFITSASVGMITPIFIIFLQDKFTSNIGPLVWAIIPGAIVAAFFRSYFGQLSDRFGRTRLMALGMFGSGIFSFLLPGLPGIVWLAIFWTLESVGWAMAGPAEEAMVADLTGNEVRGLGYGLYTFVSSMGASVGPLAGGWLYDSIGQAVPFYFNGVVLLMGALLVLLLLGEKRLSS